MKHNHFNRIRMKGWGNRLIFFLPVCTVFLLFSCVSHKNLLSIQGNYSENHPVDFRSPNLPYLVQPGDILDIRVSSMDPQSVAIFNKEIGLNRLNPVNDAAVYMNGYVVNDSGFVSVPVIGKIFVKDLKLTEIKEQLEKELSSYYKLLSVDVKMMSFKVTVMGEVNNQGTFSVYNENMNLIQILGLAGGVTDFANRKKIGIIRKVNNENKVQYVDITNINIIESDLYYIRPYDIIYVEPLKAKTIKLNSPAVQILLSGLTFIIVVVNLIRN